MTVLGINTSRGDATKGEFGLAAVTGREHEFRDDFSATLQYARSIHARSIHVMAGKVAVEERTRARETLIYNLAYASALATKYSVQLLLEPLNPHDNPGYFYSTLGEAMSIIEELALPNLKLQFDVYHVARTEGEVLAKLQRYLSLIGNVQVAAVPSRSEPDEGEIDYRVIFDALDSWGYGHYVGCEYKPRGDTDIGLAWLNAVNNRHM
jgi:hydroxypyruvate isomerase